MTRIAACLALITAVATLPAQDPAKNKDLPAGALFRLGEARARFSNNVMATALSPDGKYLAYVNQFGEALLADPESFKEVQRLVQLLHPQLIAFSGDSKLLAVAGYNLAQGIYILEVPSGKEVARVMPANAPNNNFRVSSISFSKDTSKILIATDHFNPQQKNSVILAETLTGKVLNSFETQAGNQHRAVLAGDGKRFVTWNMNPTFANNQQVRPTIHVWEADKGTELKKLTFDRLNITGGCLSPDGKTFAASSGQSTYCLFDLEKLEEIQRFAGRKGIVQALQFSPDGKQLLSGSVEGTVQGWNTSDWKRLDLPQIPRIRIGGFGFQQNGGLIAVGSENQLFSVYDVRTGLPLQSGRGHTYPIRSVSYLDAKTLVSASADGKVCYWDLAQRGQIKHLMIRDDDPNRYGPVRNGHFLISTDGALLAGGSEYNNTILRLWNLPEGKLLFDFDAMRFYSGNQSGATPFAFSKDGVKIAGISAAGLHVWETASGKEYPPLVFEEDKNNNPNQGGFNINVASLAFSPNGRFIAASRQYYSNNQQQSDFSLWDLEKKARLNYLRLPFTGTSQMICMAPNSKSVAVPQNDRTLLLYKTSNGKEFQRLTGPVTPNAGNNMPTAIAFSPDGRLLAGVYSHFSVVTTPLPGGGARSTSVQSNRIVLWEIASGTVRMEFDLQAMPILCLTFSPDGKTLITGGQDATLVAWDLEGKTPTPFAGGGELEDAWKDLINKDGKKVYQERMRRFVASPNLAIPFLAEKLVPIKTVEINKDDVKKWVSELDDADFPTRNKANRALEALGDAVEADILKALEKAESLETQRRLQNLIAVMKAKLLTEDQMRHVRVVEILERIGSKEARELLVRYADGAPTARLTQDAREALDRLP